MRKFAGRVNFYWQDDKVMVHIMNASGKTRMKIPLDFFRELVKIVEQKAEEQQKVLRDV